MGHCVPDWSMEDDYRALPANQMKSTRSGHELVELLWQNGHVVMHSQTHRKTATSFNETKQCQRHEANQTMLKFEEPLEDLTRILEEEEETTPWLHYPLEDSLDKEFCLDFYGLPIESPTMDTIKNATAKGGNFGAAEENSMEDIFKQSTAICFEKHMLPAKSRVVTSFPQARESDTGDIMNFSNFSRPLKTDLAPMNVHLGEKNLGNMSQGDGGEAPSVMTKDVSICGSNQVQGQFSMNRCNSVRVPSEKVVKKNDAQTGFGNDTTHTDTHETTVTSSSGGQGCCFGTTGQKSASSKSHKRKGRDADESEFQSEEAEYESMEGIRPLQRSASARRSRAAEVHNLAERRRRDKINEKMKALQELIPHCNKSDKASMLDEAIEYLKSLQLQLQMMWMGGSMAALMFPGMQHYMSHMGVGHGHIPPVHGPIHLPRVPLVIQPMTNPAVNQGYQASVCPSPFLSPVNFQFQMQSSHMPESYAHSVGYNRMQNSPQAMNLYGPLLMQQNQMTLAASSSAQCDLAAPSGNTQNGKIG